MHTAPPRPAPPPPPPRRAKQRASERTSWTRLVLPPVLSGHVSSLLVHFWRVARSVRPATCDGGGGRFDPESAEGSDALSMEELQKGLRLGLKTKAFVRSPPRDAMLW